MRLVEHFIYFRNVFNEFNYTGTRMLVSNVLYDPTTISREHVKIFLIYTNVRDALRPSITTMAQMAHFFISVTIHNSEF